MFKGIQSINELLKKADDGFFHEKLNSIITLLQDSYKFHRKLDVGSSDKSLDASTYNKLMMGLSKIQKGERPMEEKIKEFSRDIELNSDLTERLGSLLITGEGNEDELAQDIAGYLITHRQSSESSNLDELSEQTSAPKDKMVHPVGEGGGPMTGMASEYDPWNKYAAEGSIPLLEKIIEFFKENPEPDDSTVHSFAEKENIDPHELEEEVYSILGAFLGGGKSNHPENKDKEYNPDQKEKGIKVEQEHVDGTNLPQEIIDLLAEKITEDHQSENDISDLEYYDRLLDDEKQMEDKSKKGE
jgi:hypothetical protein